MSKPGRNGLLDVRCQVSGKHLAQAEGRGGDEKNGLISQTRVDRVRSQSATSRPPVSAGSRPPFFTAYKERRQRKYAAARSKGIARGLLSEQRRNQEGAIYLRRLICQRPRCAKVSTRLLQTTGGGLRKIKIKIRRLAVAPVSPALSGPRVNPPSKRGSAGGVGENCLSAASFFLRRRFSA